MSKFKVPGFLKREDDSLVYTLEGEMIYYVPESYFERGYAEIIGEMVNLIGIFDYTRVDEKGKNCGLKQFNFPTLFLCQPSEIQKVKDIKLTKQSVEQSYRLLKFKKGDKAVVSVKVAEDVENAETFYKMFTTGLLPTTIPYDKIQDYFIENINLNGADYGLSIQMFGIIISEVVRSKEDIKTLFCQTEMKDMHDYNYISLKQIPKYVSPFTSITSENFDESVINAVVNKNHKYSPLEKLFTL